MIALKELAICALLSLVVVLYQWKIQSPVDKQKQEEENMMQYNIYPDDEVDPALYSDFTPYLVYVDRVFVWSNEMLTYKRCTKECVVMDKRDPKLFLMCGC